MLTGIEASSPASTRSPTASDFIELPLVGGKPFDDLAGSLRACAPTCWATSRARTTPTGSEILQDKTGSDSLFEDLLTTVRQKLFDGLHTLNSALFAFVVPDRDATAPAVRRQRQRSRPSCLRGAEDIELVLTPEGALTFNIKFGASGRWLDRDRPERGDSRHGPQRRRPAAGSDRLPAGRRPGHLGRQKVYLDTSGINTAGEEAALDIDLNLVPSSSIEGTSASSR